MVLASGAGGGGGGGVGSDGAAAASDRRRGRRGGRLAQSGPGPSSVGNQAGEGCLCAAMTGRFMAAVAATGWW